MLCFSFQNSYNFHEDIQVSSFPTFVAISIFILILTTDSMQLLNLDLIGYLYFQDEMVLTADPFKLMFECILLILIHGLELLNFFVARTDLLTHLIGAAATIL